MVRGETKTLRMGVIPRVPAGAGIRRSTERYLGSQPAGTRAGKSAVPYFTFVFISNRSVQSNMSHILRLNVFHVPYSDAGFIAEGGSDYRPTVNSLRDHHAK